MKARHSWRVVAAALAVVIVMAATPAVAQASTGTLGGSSWIEWVITQVGQLWQVVAGGTHLDGGEQVPGPKG